MKKLILTLFLASASLVSFAQSTVKTIRIAATTTVLTENIPQGTQVVLLSTNAVYTATVGIAKDTGDNSTTFASAVTASSLVTVTDTNVYSVIKEAEVSSADVTAGKIDVDVSSPAADGALVAIAASDFKVYVNGSLLATGAYTLLGTNIEIPASTGIYEFDQVSVVYNTIK